MTDEEARRRGAGFARAGALRSSAALERGRQVHQANAAVARLVRQGRVDGLRLLAGTLNADHEGEALCMRQASGWTVERALKTIPGVGPVKCHTIMATAQVSPKTKLGQMTSVRRTELARLTRAAIGR